jgi:hypothetical protein
VTPGPPGESRGRVRWLDQARHAERGFSSFLDLQKSECGSPLNKRFEEFADKLWYKESELAAGSAQDDSEIASESAPAPSGIPVRHDRCPSCEDAPAQTCAAPAPVDLADLLDLSAEAASSADAAASPADPAAGVTTPSLPLPPRVPQPSRQDAAGEAGSAAGASDPAVSVALPPRASAGSEQPSKQDAAATVTRLAHLLTKKDDGAENTPTSILDLQEACQLFGQATQEQINEALHMSQSEYLT